MARVAINTGASANDGTGNNLRVAGGILNSNFLELYTYLGAGSTTVLSAPIWSSTNAGINTLRNVGIGTTNPTSALTVTGNTLISGVTTSQNGFTSGIGVTNPVKIAVSGNTLTFTVVGVGSTSLIIY